MRANPLNIPIAILLILAAVAAVASSQRNPQRQRLSLNERTAFATAQPPAAAGDLPGAASMSDP